MRSGHLPASSMAAHRAQRDRPSRTGPPHRVQQPAARLRSYRSFSAACLFSRHGVQVVPPSTGGRLPHLIHKPASRRAFCRFLLLARAARLFAFGSEPPYLRPRAFPAAYFARSNARRFSRHGSQDERSGAAGCLPHLMHVPPARRTSISRRERSRPYSRARSESLRGTPAALSRASRARLAAFRFSLHGPHTERSGAGGLAPHLGHLPAAIRAAVRRATRSRSRCLRTSTSR